MRKLIAYNLITGLCMAFNGNLVGHGAAGAKNGCFHAKHAGTFGFQRVYAGVFAKNIIAYSSFHHSLQHARGWLGNSIGAEVYCHKGEDNYGNCE
jgi:hypothetical protein